MSTHLLLVTLGPVQEFISQARRTRDLWYGSHLLSELGRAAARALLEGGAELVFPALEAGDPELAPCPAPLRGNGKPPVSIANKLLAEVPSGIEARTLAAATRRAVMQFWRERIAADVKKECGGLLARGIDPVWEEQIDSFLEFSAGWAPLADYADTRRELEQAIAGRKNLRDFSPWGKQRRAVPKSSLDGARETVLARPQERDRKLVRKYRIADGEQLDAVGLVKRAGGEPGQFVPIVNVALACWLARANEAAPGELEALRRACENAGIARISRALPCARPFPFDASVLLPSRWQPTFEELRLREDSQAWGERHVSPLLVRRSAPLPYVACLVADGDRMGQRLDACPCAKEHRALSRDLAVFARQARRIVEEHHRGVLVYAGGDDVLAFLSLPEALACADELRSSFFSRHDPSDRPTLSVGLGIGHVLESMGDLLQLGREAEREAKRGRNALAVIVDKRSGGRHAWRAGWEEDPVRRLGEDTRLLEERLSSRKVYEVARTLRRLPSPAVPDPSRWTPVLACEIRRLLARAGDEGVEPEEVGLSLEAGATYREFHAAAEAWVDRMLVARLLSEAEPRGRARLEEARS